MGRRTWWAVLGAVLWSSACSGEAPSARQVVEAAGAKVGPPRALAFRARGTLNQAAELQGSRPGAGDRAPFRETLALAPGGELVHEMELNRIDGTREWIREVFDGESKTLFLLEDSVIVRLTDHPEVGGLPRLGRRVPAMLLAEVAASPDEALFVEHAGDTARIRWTPPEGIPLTLTIGPDSLLRRLAYRVPLPALGETQVTWAFEDYRTGETGLLPHRYSARIGQATFVEMELTWSAAGPDSVRSLAARPEGFRGPIEVSGSAGATAQAEVEEVGPGLYRVRNLRTGFHPLFVEFADFVVVVDAPTGYPIMLEIPPGDVAPGPSPEWLSEVMSEIVSERLVKPIRHVILTHLHNDHAGGAPAFAQEGVTFYASPGDTSGVRSMLAAAGDTGSIVEAVSQGARITDGVRTMDVIQIGPNPHTHEMLIAYLHDPETLFVSDLVPGTTAEDLFGPDLTPAQAFFRSWLGRTPFGSAQLLTMHGLGIVNLGDLPRP